jgi:hypothetical protein
MKKFIPSMPELVKGLLITMVGLFVVKFLPASVKAKLMA